MDLRGRLSLMPPGTLIPAEWVLAELERERGAATLDAHRLAVPGDLTVEEVAERTRRSANTVRDWIRDGRLRAYKLNGRDYRVSPAALEEFLAEQRAPKPREATAGKGRADLGAWRRHRPSSAA